MLKAKKILRNVVAKKFQLNPYQLYTITFLAPTLHKLALFQNLLKNVYDKGNLVQKGTLTISNFVFWDSFLGIFCQVILNGKSESVYIDCCVALYID